MNDEEQPRPQKTRELDINVLPQSYRRRRLTGKQLMVTGALVVAVGLAVLLYLFVSSAISRTASLESELDALTLQLQTKQAWLTRETQLKASAGAYQSVTEDQGKFVAELQKVTGKADAISGLDLDSVSLGGDDINLGGTADTAAIAEAYVAALKQEWGASAVSLKSLLPTAWPEVTFTVTVIP